MSDPELDRLKSLLATIDAANPQTTVYDVARETLRWRIEEWEKLHNNREKLHNNREKLHNNREKLHKKG